MRQHVFTAPYECVLLADGIATIVHRGLRDSAHITFIRLALKAEHVALNSVAFPSANIHRVVQDNQPDVYLRDAMRFVVYMTGLLNRLYPEGFPRSEREDRDDFRARRQVIQLHSGDDNLLHKFAVSISPRDLRLVEELKADIALCFEAVEPRRQRPVSRQPVHQAGSSHL